MAASRRAAAGKEARQAGAYRDNPAESLKAELAGNKQTAYSQGLKQGYRDLPENVRTMGPEAMAEADKAYSAAAKAMPGLNKPVEYNLASFFRPGRAAGAAIGSAIAGPPGAAVGALAQPYVTPVIESVAGRASIGAGKAAQAVGSHPGQIQAAGEFVNNLRKLLGMNSANNEGER